MITLTLPWPPSVNHYWRMWRGRMLISREGRRYRQAVADMLSAQRLQPTAARLLVEITLHPPDRRLRDIDNSQKAVLDALEHGGAYVNDGQIDKLVIERCEVTPGGRAVVTIKERR